MGELIQLNDSFESEKYDLNKTSSLTQFQNLSWEPQGYSRGGGGTPILRVSTDVRQFLKKFAPMMGAFWGIPAPIMGTFLEILPPLGVKNGHFPSK